MLVLTRTEGRRIIIDHAGERLTVTAVECCHGKVRLSFTGSEDFNILREEVTRRQPTDLETRMGGVD